MATNNATNTSNPVTVAQGGTGLATLTSHSVQVGNGTGTVTQIGVGATGTVMIGNTGADPSFSATPSVTSITLSSGTALSNYTEGTWTPTLTGATTTGSTTYTTQVGYYTRIGNMVFVQGRFDISAATGTGDATIGGLPFTIKSQTGGDIAGPTDYNSTVWTWPALTTTLVVYGTNNTTTALLKGFGNAVAAANFQMANGALQLNFTLVYQV